MHEPVRATIFSGAISTRSSGTGVVGTAVVEPTEPLLAGHYPGFAILPGVCLVELAQRTVAAGEPGALEAVDSARFLAPVLPGDTVTIEARALPGGDGRWSATLSTARGKVAEVRLRQRAPEDPAALPGEGRP